jgi:malonyl-CoA O-methyltransferase
LPDGRQIPEKIHIYALEPLRIAGKCFGDGRYADAVERALGHYLSQPDLTRFDTLSHFHAYVLEALVDLGHPEEAAQGMAVVERLQRADGAVPGYPDVDWVCSSGLAQFAMVWYKLGKRVQAVKAFDCLSRLQNNSGGFYGSYGNGADYVANQEISWAVKYFLDAYYWHVRTAFDAEVASFPETIEETDGRLQAVLRSLGDVSVLRCLDAGCGKGRFLRVLLARYPAADLWGVDLSDAMLRYVPSGINTRQGSLLNLPFADGVFDRVFSVEALEHAINPEVAVRELCRVLKPGGRIVIVDKNVQRYGALQIEAWERWFGREEVTNWLRRDCNDVRSDLICWGNQTKPDGLFIAWQGMRR